MEAKLWSEKSEFEKRQEMDLAFEDAQDSGPEEEDDEEDDDDDDDNEDE